VVTHASNAFNCLRTFHVHCPIAHYCDEALRLDPCLDRIMVLGSYFVIQDIKTID